jgi:hypothetical protein
MRPSAGAHIVTADAPDEALSALGYIYSLAIIRSAEFPASVDLRRLAPPAALLDGLAALQLARHASGAARKGKAAVTADSVNAELSQLLAAANLESIAGGKGLLAR